MDKRLKNRITELVKNEYSYAYIQAVAWGMRDSDTSMNDITSEILKQKAATAKTTYQAQECAIEWQHWQSDVSMSWQEVSNWSILFRDLAKKFDLIEEFTENGII